MVYSQVARSHVARNPSRVARNFGNVARKKKSSHPKKQILKRSDLKTEIWFPHGVVGNKERFSDKKNSQRYCLFTV